MTQKQPRWEHRLATALECARSRSFSLGQHDCATWAFDVRRDLTDGEDVAGLWRGRYGTARGAMRVMRRLGWVDLSTMGRTLLGDPLSTPRLAQRGDIVLGGADPAFGICFGARAGFVGPGGLVSLPLGACQCGWRV